MVRLRKTDGEARTVALRIARYGIFVHAGAGRGHGGLEGSEWRNVHGRLVRTNPLSMGLMNSGNRRANSFLRPVMDSMLPELHEIALRYFGSLGVRDEDVGVNLKL
jgi:hypothetical protein